MENTVLEVLKVEKDINIHYSHGYTLTRNKIESNTEKIVFLPQIFEDTNILTFYADVQRKIFTVLTGQGKIYQLDKEDSNEWICIAEPEKEILGYALNSTNGNILICTDSELFLIDRNANLLRKKEIEEEMKKEIAQEEGKEIQMKWSIDGQYIFVLAGATITFYSYYLEHISTTRTASNRVMNSRLMGTKKHLSHESAYVDVVSRVSMPDDSYEYIESEADSSVLFEPRTRYKTASWHNLFSLVYAVTEDNKIFLVERNGLKFKHIQHIRHTEREKERIVHNNIIAINSHSDYLYLVNEENGKCYLKVYYIKNNCIYLKSCLDLEQTAYVTYIPNTKLSITIDYDTQMIKVLFSNKCIVLKQRKVLNRTEADVVDVDGARLLFYNFSKSLMPPPLFSRFISLEMVPQSVICEKDRKIYVQYTENKRVCVEASNSMEHKSIEEDYDYPVEVPDTCKNFKVPIGKYNGKKCEELFIDYDGALMDIKWGEKEKKSFTSITSFAVCKQDQFSLLLSKTSSSFTYIIRVFLLHDYTCLKTETILKTGKDSKIVFVGSSYIILTNEYGTLETFYPEFMISYQISCYRKSNNIKAAIEMVRRYGSSAHQLIPFISSSIRNNSISPALLLKATKTLLASEDGDALLNLLSNVEEYAEKNLCLQDAQLDQQVDKQVGEKKNIYAENTDILCFVSLLVEIYLYRNDFLNILLLAKRYAPNNLLSPLSFTLSPEHSVALSILKASIPTIGQEKLLAMSMQCYAYTLCYLILHITDSSQEEINDILLVEGKEMIDPDDLQEEIQRRLKIASLHHCRREQVLYTLFGYLTTKAENHPNNDEHDEQERAVATITKEYEKMRIRDYYLYLIEELNKQTEINAINMQIQKIQERKYKKVFSICADKYKNTICALLLHAGSILKKEQSMEEALSCYAAAGKLGESEADSLRISLGLWKDLLYLPEKITHENLEKLENVLLNKIKDPVSAADMHLKHGSYDKGVEILTKEEQFKHLFSCIDSNMIHNIAKVVEMLISKVLEYTEKVDACMEKYQENRKRLASVRERKDKERDIIIENSNTMYNCDNDTVYSRSFITNTFMTSTTTGNKKKKRSSKLRNTVGGRYEEEYVQYILSEIVKKIETISENAYYVDRIIYSLSKENSEKISINISNTVLCKYLFSKKILHEKITVFLKIIYKSINDDFSTRNTEDDPLYDPERPIIPQPGTEKIEEHLLSMNISNI